MKTSSISIIVPTLNEEKHIWRLLKSVRRQDHVNYEVLIVDGGSKDETLDIAKQYNAKILVLPEHGEFVSRNIGAKEAKGRYLIFTGADIFFPNGLFEKIVAEFEKKPKLVALTGSGYPYDATLFGKIEYAVYNSLRYLFANLPNPLKRFSTSTNFLAVREECFEKIGGFVIDDINSDGIMGRRLLDIGEVTFLSGIHFYLSARRMKNMGLLNFNRHYLYVLENFLPLSDTRMLRNIKHRSKSEHQELHKMERESTLLGHLTLQPVCRAQLEIFLLQIRKLG